MKILNVDDLIEAAEAAGLPDVQTHIVEIELAVQSLADCLAQHLGVRAGDVKWQGKSFAGLAVSFRPAHSNQPCPEPIHNGDVDGDWENNFRQPNEN